MSSRPPERDPVPPWVGIAAVAGLEGWWAWQGVGWLGPLLGWAAASTGWVAFAYAVNRPRLLGKLDHPTLGGVLLLPYLAFVRGVALAARRVGLVERVEVAPGFWVGAWPRSGESALAHLDCTAELPRRVRPAAYRCVPMLDGAPPGYAEWTEAVEQVLSWRAEGRDVLVHCAFGHGRSVTVLVGALVLAGVEPDVDAAFARVRAVRPRARATPSQREMARLAVARWRHERSGL